MDGMPKHKRWNYKTSKRKHRRKSFATWGKEFLKRVQNTETIKEKNDKLDLLKIKIFTLWKIRLIKWKASDILGEHKKFEPTFYQRKIINNQQAHK